MKSFMYAFGTTFVVLAIGLAAWQFLLSGDKEPVSGGSEVIVVGATGSSGEVVSAESVAREERARLNRSFNSLVRDLGNPAGASFGPLDGSSQTTVGNLKSGAAWSTSKVPVAIAVLNDGGESDSTMSAAITRSDNDSAERMWSSLGSPRSAGEKVEAVLHSAGDDDTAVQTKRVRPEFTAFGQTHWSLSRQQKLARFVACDDSASQVYELMAEVTPEQRWGIAEADPQAHFKGGWGPTTSGGYLVRQLGVMQNQDGDDIAVAIMVDTSSSDQNAGAKQLGRIARWIAKHAHGSAGC